MNHTVKNLEGIKNFLSVFSFGDEERRMTEFDGELRVSPESFLRNREIFIKSGKGIEEGDTILVEYTDYLRVTGEPIERSFAVEVQRHDSFLLKTSKTAK